MRKILIINPDKNEQEFMKPLLEGDVYEAHMAENGYEALETFEVIRPDIVVTASKMSGIDGIEVLRHLKELNPDVEVVFVADHDEIHLAAQALELGASDFIVKPLHEEILSVVVERALEKIWMRNRLQEAIEEIRKRHDFEHELILTSMDGIIANDRTGKIIIFNEGASRIYGYSREEALSGLNVTSLYESGKARKIKKMIYGPEYGGPGRLINYEALALTKQGRFVPILLSATLIYEQGFEVATVGYFKDLTEIKRLQEELVQSTEILAFGQAVDEMAEKAKSILYGMKLGGFMVEKGLEKMEPGQLKKGWSLVSTSMEQISRLTQDMESYARNESDHRDFISMNDLAEKVCEIMAEEIQEKGVLLERHLMADLPHISVDAQKIQTCILQLLTNALEAFPEESEERRIVLRTYVAENDQVCLEVTDTGKGINQKLQKEIFNPFFTTKSIQGTGLGLAMTQKIIREHNGSIQVESEPDHGSTFTIFLPIDQGS